MPVQAVTPPSATPTTNTFRRTGDRSFEVVAKTAGKVTTTNWIVVSPDGKTLTQTTTGTNVRGETLNNVAVYEKQ